MSIHADRLSSLRHILKKQRLDAFIIPHGDIWEKEDVEPSQRRFQFLCGLKATAGYCVVTKDKAVVMIDGRYTEQAKSSVDPALFETANYMKQSPIEWVLDHLKKGQVIGYDPWLHSCKNAKEMQKACNAAGVILHPVTENPVEAIWTDRPAPYHYKAIAHDIHYAGLSVDQKLEKLAATINENEADSMIITAPDSLGWLLNLRATENPRSPGIRGFGIFQTAGHQLTVFTDTDCAAFDQTQTQTYEVDFLPLSDFPMAIHHFEQKEQVIQLSDDAPDWFTDHLNAPASRIITRPDPIQMMKAVKNEVEQACIRDCHRRDGMAIIRAIETIKTAQNITESDVADIILKERQKDNLFRGVSFDTIVGWNANGAKIHGTPSDTIISGHGLLLVDSGGQYDDGTTDITRTIPIGTPPQEMCEKFTIVLKAHIAIATAIFPVGTTGVQLDSIARKIMWDYGLDYAHGTGHGVGFFLNVHEGPCGISPKSSASLCEGMLVSNEPGYYEEGAFGIRHENLMLVQPCPTHRGFLSFETVTFVPFDETCIRSEMLSEQEKEWLQSYNNICGNLLRQSDINSLT